MKIVKVFLKRLLGYGSDRKCKKIASASLLIIVIIASIIGCSGTKENTLYSSNTISDIEQMSEDFNFLTLIEYTIQYAKTTDEYKTLPEAKGCYE